MDKLLLFPLLLFFLACSSSRQEADTADDTKIILKDALVIDGTGADARQADIAIFNGLIAAIDSQLDTSDAKVINLAGKTVLPAFISAHVHIGTLKGTSASA